jgi:hypothetical protein
MALARTAKRSTMSEMQRSTVHQEVFMQIPKAPNDPLEDPADALEGAGHRFCCAQKIM